MSLWGAITGIIKAPFVFVANMWDTWSDWASATAGWFAGIGAVIGAFLAVKSGKSPVAGALVGALGGLAVSAATGAAVGAADGAIEGVKTAAGGAFGDDDEPDHGLNAQGRETPPPERTA